MMALALAFMIVAVAAAWGVQVLTRRFWDWVDTLRLENIQ